MAIREEMERDSRVFVLGEDVGKKGGVFKATNGLYEQFGEERVIDTPLAESAIAGVGIGAAMYGMRPIAEMQFADFIMPAVNQIVSEAAKIRYRSNNDWSCPITIRAPYGGGVHGAILAFEDVGGVVRRGSGAVHGRVVGNRTRRRLRAPEGDVARRRRRPDPSRPVLAGVSRLTRLCVSPPRRTVSCCRSTTSAGSASAAGTESCSSTRCSNP